MNLQTITERLNDKFKSDDRKLVFWYDDNGESLKRLTLHDRYHERRGKRHGNHTA